MKRYSLPVFFVLTFILTWALWLPAALTKLNGGESALGPDGIGQFARWSSGLVAIVLAGLLAGRQGIGDLFRPLKIWRVNIGWYLFALLFQLVLFILSKWIDTRLGNAYEVVSPLESVPYPVAFVIPIVIISAIPGAFMEELGWRGFALPRLQTKNNALFSSIMLGLVWGIWHIPSMLYFGETNGTQIFWAVLNFIPITVLFTWLFNNTKGSLLLVTLFHASIQYSNNFLGVIPTQTSSLILWLVALVIVWMAGVEHLSRSSERVQRE